MVDAAVLMETALRGGAAGISLLLSIVLAAGGVRERRRLLGALFSFSVGIYVLLAGEATQGLFGSLKQPAIVVAIWGTVFFWWFAAALFDDDFRWRWWRFAPLVLLPALHVLSETIEGGPLSTFFQYLQPAIRTLLFVDVFRLAISNIGDDLVDPRRRFRLFIAISVAIFGIAVAAAEAIKTTAELPGVLHGIQAIAVFIMNMIFGSWILYPRADLLENKAPEDAPHHAAETDLPQNPAERLAYDRLMALMDAGVYREEKLTIARLAHKVGIPEHALRRLINRSLGYRNFSAFLNAWRIADARQALADAATARRQILQIALDLGFGSIAPFNRAFRQATGLSPTEYRRKMLG